MARSTVAVRFTGDVSNLKGAIGEAEGRLSRLGSAAAKFGRVAAVGIAGAGAGALLLGKEVLGTGAQLESFRKKTATVFEGSAKDVKAWADKNNEVFGLTDDQLAGLAANFGDLLKPMGFTADQAADMATDVVGLSGALSEWSGGTKSAAEVSAILSKAMLGEREGLKELGISITEADVSARLAAKGQDELTGAALDQAKAIATQELIFEKSTDAQKAFADGGNKALRAQNNLKAGLGELREQMADKLLPIATKVTQWAADNLPRAMELAGRAAQRVQAVWAAVWPTVSSYIEAFRVVVERVVNFVSGLFSRSESDVGGSASKLQEIIGKLRETFASTFEAVSVAIDTFVKVATELWDRFGSYFLDYAKRQFGYILQVISGALTLIQGVLNVFIGIFTGDWSRVWEGVKGIASGAWNVISGVVKGGLNAIRLAFDGARAAISAAWGFMWDGIKTAASDAASNLVGFMARLPERIVRAVGDLGGVLYGAGKALMEGLLNGIKAGFEKVAGFAGGIAGKIAKLKGPLDYDRKVLVANGEALMSGLNAGIKGGLSDVLSTVSGIAPAMPGAVSFAGGGTSPVAATTINLVVDGRVLASVVNDHNADRDRRNGRLR